MCKPNETLASIYENLANIAFDKGNEVLAQELWEKHLDYLEPLSD